MAERTLIAKIRPDEKEPEVLIVASPVVGIADGIPRTGVFLNPLDKVLTIKVLNERYTLRLPRDIHGRVTEAYIPNAHSAVAFNDALVRLDPRVLQAGEGPEAGATRGGGSAGDAEDANLIKVTAPSEGIFYRRPTPDTPSYVEVGAQVSTGSVLGLVEVMKCFNQITYGGPGLPERGEIAKILADDAGEVQFGQELFWIKPLE